MTEAGKSYIRAANRAGLHNTVTGKLPGDRPYNLVTALTRPKRPEIDGYNELGEDNDGDSGDTFSNSDNDDSFDRRSNMHDGLPGYIEALPSNEDQRDSAFNVQPEKIEPVREITTGVLVVSTANKGGVGKTTAAIATATALSRSGIPTVLVDLDLGAPDLATFFSIRDVPGIEKLSNLNNINPVQIDRLLVKVEDNLYVIPGSMTKVLPRFDGSELSIVMDYLKGKFAVVVCDTSPEPWTKRWLYSTFEAADIALAVVDQSKFSEEETRKYAPTIVMMGVKPSKIRIVINRFSPKLHPAQVIESMFNSGFKKTYPANLLPKIGAIINNNWDASVRGTYDGEIGLDSASEWHKLAKEIAELAGYRYEPTNSGGPRKRKPSLIDKFFKKGER
jgi:cellulose biosynthesis protein BcsQ